MDDEKLDKRIDISLKIAQLFLVVSSIPISLFLYFRYESLQKKLTINNLKSQAEIADIKLKRDRTIPVDIQQVFKANPVKKFSDGTFAFNVQVSYSIKNLSNHNILVPFHIFNVFIGETLSKETLPHVIYPINDPPDPSFSSSVNLTPKNIKWNLSHCEITRFRGDIVIPKNIHYDSCLLKTGGWGTGPLKPGISIGNDYRLLVRAMPVDYISYIIKITYGTERDVLEQQLSISDLEPVSISDLSTFGELQKQATNNSFLPLASP